jgi:hypothetical protein
MKKYLFIILSLLALPTLSYALSVNPTSYVENSDEPFLITCDNSGDVYYYFVGQENTGFGSNCYTIPLEGKGDLNVSQFSDVYELPATITLAEWASNAEEEPATCETSTLDECENAEDTTYFAKVNFTLYPEGYAPPAGGYMFINVPPVGNITASLSLATMGIFGDMLPVALIVVGVILGLFLLTWAINRFKGLGRGKNAP